MIKLKLLSNFFILFAVFTTLTFLTPNISYAQCPPYCGTQTGGPGVSSPVSVTLKNPIEPIDNLNDFIKTLLEAVIRIGLPLIAIAIIYSGYLYVSAMGNSGKLEVAHRAFMFTLVGAAILLAAWALAQVITDTVINISS